MEMLKALIWGMIDIRTDSRLWNQWIYHRRGSQQITGVYRAPWILPKIFNYRHYTRMVLD